MSNDKKPLQSPLAAQIAAVGASVRINAPTLPPSVKRTLEEVGREATESIFSSPSWQETMRQIHEVAGRNIVVKLPKPVGISSIAMRTSTIDFSSPRISGLRPKRAIVSQRPDSPSRFRSGADDGHPGNFI